MQSINLLHSLDHSWLWLLVPSTIQDIYKTISSTALLIHSANLFPIGNLTSRACRRIRPYSSGSLAVPRSLCSPHQPAPTDIFLLLQKLRHQRLLGRRQSIKRWKPQKKVETRGGHRRAGSNDQVPYTAWSSFGSVAIGCLAGPSLDWPPRPAGCSTLFRAISGRGELSTGYSGRCGC